VISRLIDLPKSRSFFLFGPRGTGKSTLLRSLYPEAAVLDLLKEADYQEFLRNPSRLEAWADANARPKRPLIIDEVQRLPELLNEVHRLIEAKKYIFILTGSSARKLRRGGSNLLAGRALVKQMHPFTARELGKEFDLRRSVRFGQLPGAYFEDDPKQYLKAYVGVYLREEVQIEAQIRNLGLFSRFLEAASFSQASVLSVAAVAQDCGIDRKTAESYFQLLEDLMIGIRVPVFRRRAKRKLVTHPKFYFFDAGVFHTLRPTGPLDPPEEIQGAAIETLVLQELRATIANHDLDLQLSYWRSQKKEEVDFVLYGKPGLIAIEVKRSPRFREQDLLGLREFLADYPVAKAYLLYTGSDRLKYGAIDVLPLEDAMKDWLGLINPKKT
jgi:predicted AAA+ superfamily ATPase